MSPNLRRFLGTVAVLLLLLLVALPWISSAQEGEEPLVHTVLPGETLYGIAARYGVSVQAIAEANDISNLDFIRSGSRLIIPVSAGQTGTVHVVQRGETLSEIAAQYGVSVDDIDLANNLIDPNYVYAGQRLYIPVVEPAAAEAEPTLPSEEVAPAESAETPVPEPAPEEAPAAEVAPEVEAAPAAETTPVAAGQEPSEVAAPPAEEPSPPAAEETPTPEVQEGVLPSACPLGCEVISIISPTMGVTVTSPLVVTGQSSGFEQDLVVRVLDATGFEIGSGSATIDGSGDHPGGYTSVVTYTMPASAQPGRIQVYSVSPQDGAIEHLTSVVVTLEGTGLDVFIEELEGALLRKDYEVLQSLITEPWLLSFYQSEGVALDALTAIEQLQTNYLGPADVFIDLSVDASGLLEEMGIQLPDVMHVLYSTGWGPDQLDDAFLLLVRDEDGQPRWGGVIYVFDALRDYEP